MAVTNTFEIFEGKLGGGKTYNAVVRIIDRLRQGGVVATNIQLSKEAVTNLVASRWGIQLQLDKQLFILNEEQISQFHAHIPLGDGVGFNPLIVVDEFHLWFNSRDFADNFKKSRPTLTFITQARKLHVDLILISQSMFNVDKQFVRMLHAVWRFRDLEKWVVPGLGIRFPFAQNYILGVQFDQDAKTVVARHWVKKDKDIFPCYETTALLRPITDLSSNVVSNLQLDKIKKPPFDWRTLRPALFVIAFALSIIVRFYFFKY
jgi:zona occludens toxin (predicted ATPase)